MVEVEAEVVRSVISIPLYLSVIRSISLFNTS
jgi:hypothetical protein